MNTDNIAKTRLNSKPYNHLKRPHHLNCGIEQGDDPISALAESNLQIIESEYQYLPHGSLSRTIRVRNRRAELPYTDHGSAWKHRATGKLAYLFQPYGDAAVNWLRKHSDELNLTITEHPEYEFHNPGSARAYVVESK
jgi:hypothetical protein